MVYFTSLFPCVLLFVFFVKGLTLDGAWDGVKYLFIPDWQQLKKSEIWIDATTQIVILNLKKNSIFFINICLFKFYSYGLGIGTIIALGSYNKYSNNCYKDTLILAFLNETSYLLSGFVIFSVLGGKITK